MKHETEEKVGGCLLIAFGLMFLGCLGVPLWAFIKIVNWMCD